jgi:tetratricopeptide (TPR) repeat protein
MLAFLAGVGEWTPGGFRTTQFLMPSYASERALLHALNQYLGDDAVLVTYNGRTFDVPVMELRGEMQRVPQVVCDMPHLDMLHAARRLWRQSEEGERSCRLTHLEESVLGVGRVGDVGGFEIPARYFQFVRGGSADLLAPVLLHNRLDLLSLAALTAHAQQLVRDGRDTPPAGATALGLAALYERGGWLDAALACYRAAADDHWQTRDLRRASARALARLLRRLRRYEEAAEAWHLVLRLGGRPQVLREAREALAIHHEHRGGQLEEARRHAVAGVEEAIGRGERGNSPGAPWRRPRCGTTDQRLTGCPAFAGLRTPAPRCGQRASPTSRQRLAPPTSRHGLAPPKLGGGGRASLYAGVPFLAFSAALRAATVVAPNLRVKRSTRPSVSTSF